MATNSESALKELVKKMIYPIRNSQIVYENIVNYQSKKKKAKIPLSFNSDFSRLSARIIEDLRVNGIAFSHINDLFPHNNFGYSFRDWVKRNESKLAQNSKKKFLYSYFGTDSGETPVDRNNPFFKFYLSDEILYLCSEYLNYLPQLNYLAVEKTVPALDLNSPQHSQNWHRDPEEKRTMKVFIYVNDVDESNGPFTYVRGSHPTSKSRYAGLFPQVLPYGSYPDAARLEDLIDPKDIVLATGNSGTVIFCDTAGIHRGGLAAKGKRIMATAFYPSQKWSEKSLVTRNSEVDLRDYGRLAPEAVL